MLCAEPRLQPAALLLLFFGAASGAALSCEFGPFKYVFGRLSNSLAATTPRPPTSPPWRRVVLAAGPRGRHPSRGRGENRSHLVVRGASNGDFPAKASSATPVGDSGPEGAAAAGTVELANANSSASSPVRSSDVKDARSRMPPPAFIPSRCAHLQPALCVERAFRPSQFFR